MGNRWRILYCKIPELRGRTRKVRAGKEKTGASAGGEGKANPPFNPVALSGAKESSEAGGASAEKSRYSVSYTRTVNRHRWMGRESQGRREKRR